VKYVNVPTNLSLPGVSCEYEKFVYGPTDELDDIFIDDKNSCRAVCMYNEKYDLMLCTKHLNKLEAGTVSRKPATTTASKTTRKTKTKTKQTANIDDENMIISHHNPATAACSFILLAGPRKGCQCEKPMWIPKTGNILDTPTLTYAFCKAHYGKCVASND
jgi:hypothetical protein